jgi:NTE family protein
MEHHWAEGRAAIAETMQHGALLASNILDGKTAAFDLTTH